MPYLSHDYASLVNFFVSRHLRFQFQFMTILPCSSAVFRVYKLAAGIPEYKELILCTIAQNIEEQSFLKGIEQGRQASLKMVIKSTGLSRETLEQPRH